MVLIYSQNFTIPWNKLLPSEIYFICTKILDFFFMWYSYRQQINKFEKTSYIGLYSERMTLMAQAHSWIILRIKIRKSLGVMRRKLTWVVLRKHDFYTLQTILAQSWESSQIFSMINDVFKNIIINNIF